MAGFKTHITASCGVGAAYGAAGYYFGMPLESCLVAGGICGIAGILPDLDSKSGVPVRETLAFAAAAVPALMLDRFQSLGFSNERIVLLCASISLIVRFGLGELFKRFTVHRGMWHSIPAAATVGCVVFLLATGINEEVRYFKAVAAVVGFLTHLFLDELWSLRFDMRGAHPKKSAGTALKFFGKNKLATVGVYTKLILFAWLASSDLSTKPAQHRGDNVRVAAPKVESDPAFPPRYLR